MKKLTALLMVLVMAGFLSLAGCKGEKKETTPKPATPAVTPKTVVYYCPAHKDKTGKKGDKCPVCGKEMVEKPAATMPT